MVAVQTQVRVASGVEARSRSKEIADRVEPLDSECNNKDSIDLDPKIWTTGKI